MLAHWARARGSRFEPEVRLHDMKAIDPELAGVAAFGSRIVPASLYATTDAEALIVLDRCGADPEVLRG